MTYSIRQIAWLLGSAAWLFGITDRSFNGLSDPPIIWFGQLAVGMAMFAGLYVLYPGSNHHD